MQAHVFYIDNQPYAFVFRPIHDGEREGLAIQIGLVWRDGKKPVISRLVMPDEPDHREAWWIATEHFLMNMVTASGPAVPYRLHALLHVDPNQRVAAYVPAMDPEAPVLLFRVEEDANGSPVLQQFAHDVDQARARRALLRSTAGRLLAQSSRQ